MTTTVTTWSDDGGSARAGNSGPRDLALVLAWSHDEPARIGEVAIVPADGETHTLGREGADEATSAGGDDAGARRISFFRQRPGVAEGAAPLGSQRISRRQLEMTAAGGVLTVKNVGRARMAHNGSEVDVARVAPGDTLEIGSHTVLVCVLRPAWIPATAQGYPAFPFGSADPFGIVGESPEAWRLREVIAFVARRAGHVLVRGESGTGKELVARAIHQLSSRAGKPLVSRNAATFPEGLVDAELFGNAKNYPNAGMDARPGLVGEADGGTLFLDEFAELPHALQAHLLRLLDAGEYTRLGESRPRTSHFRLVAATNRPESALKHDVLARIHFRVELPGLGARIEDVPLLLRELVRRAASDDPEAVARFVGKPGGDVRVSTGFVRDVLRRTYTTHVRELESLLWAAMLGSRGDRIEGQGSLPRMATGRPSMYPDMQSLPPPPAPPTDPDDIDADDSAPGGVTPERIQAVLDAHNGVIEQAYRALGLPSRHALARLIRKHRLQVRRTPR